MARRVRPQIITLTGSVACGAADGSNLILNEAATANVGLTLPFDGMTCIGAQFVQRVAGTGTGTFSVAVAVGSGNVQVSEASAVTMIDADGAVGLWHGNVEGSGNCGAAGQQIKITTVKTGTVSGNATLEVTLFFML